MRALAALVAAAVALAGCARGDEAESGYPRSMAALGDSITRAFNLCPLPFADCRSSSWSTGTHAVVDSHYRRILAADDDIENRAFNDAVSGAEMEDLDAQAARAVSQRVQYVTILMGANDACAGSEAAMTRVATFRAQLDRALQRLASGLPEARVYVASVPDVYQLWAIYKDSPRARTAWSVLGICRSLLARPLSEAPADVARRARVRQRLIDYNEQLAQACAAYARCRFDGNAVFETPFARADVSTRDYFHPSLVGQAKLADVSWASTFDFEAEE